jgi:hypothetical protein
MTSWWNFSERLSLRVFHLTRLRYSIQIHGSPSVSIALIVQTENNTARWQLCARGIRGKQLIEGKAGHCSGYPQNCARFRQGIERGYRSEKCHTTRPWGPVSFFYSWFQDRIGGWISHGIWLCFGRFIVTFPWLIAMHKTLSGNYVLNLCQCSWTLELYPVPS